MMTFWRGGDIKINKNTKWAQTKNKQLFWTGINFRWLKVVPFSRHNFRSRWGAPFLRWFSSLRCRRLLTPITDYLLLFTYAEATQNRDPKPNYVRWITGLYCWLCAFFRVRGRDMDKCPELVCWTSVGYFNLVIFVVVQSSDGG